MRRYVLPTLAGVGAGFLVACSAVLGVDDYAVVPAVPDANTLGDSGGDADAIDSGGSSGIDSGSDAGHDAGDSGIVDGGGDTSVVKECTLNADCAPKGDKFICRKTDFKCVSIVSADCAHLVGDTWKDDNAILIGQIAPTAGADLTSGLPEQNAVDLAITDFNGAGGLPGGRKLALIGCNDNSDGTQAVNAAKHLVNNVGVPAIIGAAFSGITLQVATVTIPAKTFLISPSATSVSLTNLDDQGYVWRTIASDNIQADADAAFYPLLQAKIRADKGDATYKVKVAIANKGDNYGTGLATALQSKLTINGADYLAAANADYRLVTDFGDPDSATAPTYKKSVDAAVAFKPDVLFLFGTTEVVTQLLKGVEEDPASPKPYYVLADGGLVGELKDYLEGLRQAPATAAQAEDLRHRIVGTVPGTTSSLFTIFTQRYASKYSDGLELTSGVANAYDALYNVAYAIAASKATTVTGTSVRDGMSKLVGGTKLDTGSTNITTAFSLFSQNKSIDYNGASGPLDYDLATGEAPGDIQIWCLPKNQSTGVISGGTGTTVIYDAASKTLKGTFATLTTDCKW